MNALFDAVSTYISFLEYQVQKKKRKKLLNLICKSFHFIWYVNILISIEINVLGEAEKAKTWFGKRKGSNGSKLKTIFFSADTQNIPNIKASLLYVTFERRHSTFIILQMKSLIQTLPFLIQYTQLQPLVWQVAYCG